MSTQDEKPLTKMSSKKQIIFIVNPISGTHGKENILRLIEERLDRSVYDYVIKKTEYAGHASSWP